MADHPEQLVSLFRFNQVSLDSIFVIAASIRRKVCYCLNILYILSNLEGAEIKELLSESSPHGETR